MKKFLIMVILFVAASAVYSQNLLQEHLKKTGVSENSGVDNPNKQVKKIYKFTRDGKSGAVLIAFVKELGTDVCFTVIKDSDKTYYIESLFAIDDSVIPAERRSAVKDKLDTWSNVKDNEIPDVISAASWHSKGMYKNFDKIIKSVIKDI